MSTTATLEQQIRDLNVANGSVAIVWLGQAGYLLKTSAGTIVMIDPYLTDWAETQWGLVRQIPSPIDPAELQPDLLLISHWHEDHLDVPLVKQWAAAGATGTFAGPVTCSVRAPVWGWPEEQVVNLDEGDRRDDRRDRHPRHLRAARDAKRARSGSRRLSARGRRSQDLGCGRHRIRRAPPPDGGREHRRHDRADQRRRRQPHHA